VLAEAELAVEPELVDRVAAVGAGLQRVGEAAAADMRQQQVGQRRASALAFSGRLRRALAQARLRGL
jgi:hypothetical protein